MSRAIASIDMPAWPPWPCPWAASARSIAAWSWLRARRRARPSGRRRGRGPTGRRSDSRTPPPSRAAPRPTSARGRRSPSRSARPGWRRRRARPGRSPQRVLDDGLLGGVVQAADVQDRRLARLGGRGARRVIVDGTSRLSPASSSEPRQRDLVDVVPACAVADLRRSRAPGRGGCRRPSCAVRAPAISIAPRWCGTIVSWRRPRSPSRVAPAVASVRWLRKPPQPQRVGDDGDAGEGHRRAGDDRVRAARARRAGARRRCRRTPRTRFSLIVRSVARQRRIASAAARRSPQTSVRSEASMATSVPVPIARPRSAWASAGASLTPSPTIATTRPSSWRRLTTSTLSAGSTSAMTSSMPTSAATAVAVVSLSPVSSTGRRPSAFSGAIGLRGASA